jgi:hypothetical protein
MEQADIQTVEVTSQGALDPEWLAMEVVCKKAALLLTRLYPNHLWMIGSAPGAVLVIKYGGADSRFGFTVDVADAHSSSELEHAIAMAGGELLERLGLPRGAWDGEQIGLKYEGQDALTKPTGG